MTLVEFEVRGSREKIFVNPDYVSAVLQSEVDRDGSTIMILGTKTSYGVVGRPDEVMRKLIRKDGP